MSVVYVEAGKLKVGGRAIQEFGVNTPDLLINWLGGPGAISPQAPWALTKAAARDRTLTLLRDHSLRFVRFAPFGHRPLTYKGAFIENQSAFLHALDELVASAERHEISLIPSLFFSQPQIPPVFGEPLSAFANPQSRSYEEFERVISVIVPRYKGSKAIAYWEFGNEQDTRINMRIPGYSVAPNMGTPARWTEADATDVNYCHTVTARFQSLVRHYDAQPAPGGSRPRAIASGLQGWRAFMSQRTDWAAHLKERLYDDQTETLTLHPYEVHGWHDKSYAGFAEYLERMRVDMEAQGKPVINGEFGVAQSYNIRGLDSWYLLDNVIDQIVRSGIQLSLLWNIPVSRGADKEWDRDPSVPGNDKILRKMMDANAKTRQAQGKP
jgi:hypothetical protein